MRMVYLIIGSEGAGRREVLHYLVRDGLDDAVKPRRILLRRGEPAAAADALLAALPDASVGTYTWSAGGMLEPDEPDDAAAVTFVVGDGRANLQDFMEAFRRWLQDNPDVELARIIEVVDCGLLHAQPGVKPWLDCAHHFADAILLNRREGLADAWLRELDTSFVRLKLPAFLMIVKNGRVPQPELVLVPETRRISQVFDDLGEDATDFEVVYEDEDGDDAGGRPEEGEGPDPWLERLASGRRVRLIPDIATFLPKR